MLRISHCVEIQIGGLGQVGWIGVHEGVVGMTGGEAFEQVDCISVVDRDAAR